MKTITTLSLLIALSMTCYINFSYAQCSSSKTLICHVATCESLCVNTNGGGPNSLSTHLAHGDVLGSCDSESSCQLPLASFTVSSSSICESSCVNFTDASTNSPTSWSWTFTGGSPSSSTSQNPTSICYNTPGTYTVSLTATNANGSDDTTMTDLMVVDTVATSSAGSDAAICEASTHILAGSIGGGASSSTWTTAGTGTFDNASLLNAVYTPSAADITAGSVVLTLTTDDPTGPCGAVADNMTLTINDDPTADAGPNATICEGSTHTLAGSIGGGASSSTWTTGGTGSFDDDSKPDAVYTPGAADITAGTVLLTLTTDDPAGPCSWESDTMRLTIDEAATANAGANTAICENSIHQLSGSIGGSASSATWTTAGDGTFNDNSLLNAQYTRGSGDLAAGSVTLTLTTDDPPGLCGAVSDDIVISIDFMHTVYAGRDTTICSISTYTITGASIGGAAEGQIWITMGTGTFDFDTLLAATYTPSPADTVAGCVKLAITTTDNNACFEEMDTMELCFSAVLCGAKMSTGMTENDREIAFEAFPNPVSETLTIQFSVFETSNVRLMLYNMHGSKVSTLFDEVASENMENIVEYDMHMLKPGIYFYHLISESTTVTGKVILVR